MLRVRSIVPRVIVPRVIVPRKNHCALMSLCPEIIESPALCPGALCPEGIVTQVIVPRVLIFGRIKITLEHDSLSRNRQLACLFWKKKILAAIFWRKTRDNVRAVFNKTGSYWPNRKQAKCCVRQHIQIWRKSDKDFDCESAAYKWQDRSRRYLHIQSF